MRPPSPSTTIRLSRGGDTLWLLISTLIVLFILGISVSYVYHQQVREMSRYWKKSQAYYLARSGLEKGVFRLKSILRSELVTAPAEVLAKAQAAATPKEPGQLNLPVNPLSKVAPEDLVIQEELLALLDVERAKDFARVYEFKGEDLPPGGTLRITAEIVNVARNPFFAHIDRVEKIPPALEVYREKRDEEGNPIPGAEPLGGWSGQLKVVSEASFEEQHVKLETVKDIRILDITPPAPDHTLFIHSKNTDELKEGLFVISNLELPPPVLDLIHQLTLRLNELLRLPGVVADRQAVHKNVEAINARMNQGIGDPSDSLKLAYQLAQHTSDENIKDMVDNIILSLDPRDWGRIRTNGVLQVYLPFFAPDDIINYFADASIFGHQRPEIGYQNCYNRLHDPYLSVYTHYEGYVYKNYRRLNPLVLGPSEEAQVVPPQRYTINTRMNYVMRYPDREAVPNLERLEKEAQKYCHALYRKPTKLVGTEDHPIHLEGIAYASDNVEIGGVYTGRGLVVCEKEIIITDDLRPLNPSKDSVGLVALKGTIKLGRNTDWTRVTAALYAFEGLRGTETSGIVLTGNLAVENLHRGRMPRWFRCTFDPHIKNHMVDNLHGTISRRLLTFKLLGLGEKG